MIELNLEEDPDRKQNVQNNFIIKLQSEIFEMFDKKLSEKNINHCMIYKVYVSELKNLINIFLKFLLKNIDNKPIEQILCQENERLIGKNIEDMIPNGNLVEGYCESEQFKEKILQKDREILELNKYIDRLNEERSDSSPITNSKSEANKFTTEITDTSEESEMESNNDLLNENNILKNKILKLEKIVKELKEDLNDKKALVQEMADKHDIIRSLHSKNAHLEELLEKSKRKVQFREEIIKELRRKNKQLEQNLSPYSITPPKTPELKKFDSCSSELLVNNLIYRSNFLTVPGQRSSLEYCSLSDTDQESNISNSNSSHIEISYDRADEGDLKRLVYERDNQIESFNVIIDKLESELHLCRRSTERVRLERDFQIKKTIYLRKKVHAIEGLILDKSKIEEKDALDEVKYSTDELTVIDEELKYESDLLKSIKKLIDTSNSRLRNISDENNSLKENLSNLKENLEETMSENRTLIQKIEDRRSGKSESSSDKEIMAAPELFDKESSTSIEVSDILKDELLMKINQKDHELDIAYKEISRLRNSMLNKDVSVEETSSLTSGNSSGGGDDMSESSPITNDLINHLDEKNLQLSEKLNEICALEEKLREKETEIFDLHKRLLNYEKDREKSLLTVNQLKNAVQTHNETIKYLEQQKVEFEMKLEENQRMLLNHNEFFDDMKKRNEELEKENKNQSITISNLRDALEDLKRNESSTVSSSKSSFAKRFWKYA